MNEQQLEHILSHGADWYNKRRSHSERDHRPSVRDEAEEEATDLAIRRIERFEELVGQLKSCRAAA